MLPQIRVFIFIIFILISCKDTEQKSANRYIDLKGFFEGESNRLQKLNLKINKSVGRNGIFESKNNITVDWKNELSLFTESDINKPAWNNSYKITGDSVNIFYTAIDSNLHTRFIHITKDTYGRLVHISILNYTRNNLYNSSESLSYTPDSTYKIIKHQDVLLLGSNKYEITGILK